MLTDPPRTPRPEADSEAEAAAHGSIPAPSGESRWYVVPGFAILVACLLLGEALRARFGLILPGNILGLFILLALLSARVVPLHWVEGAGRGLLWLLPLLFVPIFVLALKDRAFWSTRGPALIPVMFMATLLLWAVSGHLAQWLLGRKDK